MIVNKIYFKSVHRRWTQDIIQRLRNYNIGRIKEVDLKYYPLVNNDVLIE